jgi:hypothetical protein
VDVRFDLEYPTGTERLVADCRLAVTGFPAPTMSVFRNNFPLVDTVSSVSIEDFSPCISVIVLDDANDDDDISLFLLDCRCPCTTPKVAKNGMQTLIITVKYVSCANHRTTAGNVTRNAIPRPKKRECGRAIAIIFDTRATL